MKFSQSDPGNFPVVVLKKGERVLTHEVVLEIMRNLRLGRPVEEIDLLSMIVDTTE